MGCAVGSSIAAPSSETSRDEAGFIAAAHRQGGKRYGCPWRRAWLTRTRSRTLTLMPFFARPARKLQRCETPSPSRRRSAARWRRIAGEHCEHLRLLCLQPRGVGGGAVALAARVARRPVMAPTDVYRSCRRGCPRHQVASSADRTRSDRRINP
jgi:hypothetical protein